MRQIGANADNRYGIDRKPSTGSPLHFPPLNSGWRAVTMRHSALVTGFVLPSSGVKRTRRLRAILIRFSQASSNGPIACGCGCLTTPPRRRSKPMSIDNARGDNTQIRVDDSQISTRVLVDTHQLVSPDWPTKLDWFEAVDALILLNSMVKRTRTGPGAKPLMRW